MAKSLWLYLSVIALLFVGGCGPTATATKVPIRSGPSVAAPVYKAGNSWVFRVKTRRVPLQEGRLTYKNGKFVTDSADFWLSSTAVTVFGINTTFKSLDFPLVPGKTWSYKYKWDSRSTGRTSWRDAQVTVIGPVSKPITTPAGQFKVVEIQRTEDLGRAERSSTYFYSKDTNSVVKMTAVTSSLRGESHFELELIKYSLQ